MSKRKNNPLFKVGDVVSVDIETGEETPLEGEGMRMLPGPPGTCAWCHVAHDPTQPHDKQSLPYQVKFYTIHGRYPTWSDAMVHCDDETRALWREHLVALMNEHGMEIPEDLR